MLDVSKEISPAVASKVLEELCRAFQTIQNLEDPDQLLVVSAQKDETTEPAAIRS